MSRAWSRLAIGRIAAGVFAVSSATAWLLSSHDPVREAIVGFVLREQTEYASGFSESALRTVERGQSESVVRQALGAPLGERWLYGPDETQPCMDLDFANDVVVSARDAEACLEVGVDAGTARSSVRDTLGSPRQACWHYTRGAGNGYFRERKVCFEDGEVLGVFREWSTGREVMPLSNLP